MTHLRQLMLEELRRRNFADTTIRTYLYGVTHFSRYFRRPPDQLSPEDIRKYQAMLFTKLKLSPNTVTLRLASLRFFYIHVLKRGRSIAETPYPKKVRHLPGVLSQEEVARLAFSASSFTLSRGEVCLFCFLDMQILQPLVQRHRWKRRSELAGS